jgi:predicted MFS family arabinose efflux permease
MKIITASTGLFVGLLGVYTIPFQIGVFVENFDLDEAGAGYLGSVELAAVAIVTMLLGAVISRFSLSKLAVSGAIVAAIGQLMSFALHDITMLCLARLFVGCGCGCVLAATTASIASSEDPDAFYGRAFAYMSLAYVLWLAAVPYAARVVPHAGIFLMLAATTLLSLPVFRNLTFIKNNKVDRPAKFPIGKSKVALLFMAITLVFVSYGGTYYFAERIGTEIGVASEDIGLAYGLSQLAGFVGAGLAGWSGARISRTGAIMTGFFLIGLISLGIVFSTGQIELLSVIILMNGVFMFTISSVLSAAAVLDKQGRMAAIANGYIILTLSMGTAIFGTVASQSNFMVLAWPAFILCCLGAIVIMPLTRALDRNERKRL